MTAESRAVHNLTGYDLSSACDQLYAVHFEHTRVDFSAARTLQLAMQIEIKNSPLAQASIAQTNEIKPQAEIDMELF